MLLPLPPKMRSLPAAVGDHRAGNSRVDREGVISGEAVEANRADRGGVEFADALTAGEDIDLLAAVRGNDHATKSLSRLPVMTRSPPVSSAVTGLVPRGFAVI